MRVKICGITTARDVDTAIDAGADMLGLNLVPGSKRQIDESLARELCERIGDRAECVLVVGALAMTEAERLCHVFPGARLQLHAEIVDTALLEGLAPRAFAAVGIASTEDVQAARGLNSDPLLVDAKVAGQSGGTGTPFDWSLVASLARERALLLAGGLTPENVADAVRQVRPWGVDVASGVEQLGQPRRKSAERMRAFVKAARGPG